MKNDNASRLLDETIWTLMDVAGRRYAIPSVNVLQSIDAPSVQKVPFVPEHVAGIAQVDGEILPCLDLSRLFGHDAEQASEALVIEHNDRRTVLLIDAALRQVSLDEDSRNSMSALEGSSDDGQAVIGEMRHEKSTVLLLDPGYLSHFSSRRQQTQGRPGLVAAQADTADTSAEHQLDTLFLYVSINQQEYALRVTDIQEIIEPGTVAAMPGAPATLAGITLVRNCSHLVIDAGECLGIEAVARSQAVMVPVRQGEILLAVSGIDAVRAVARHHVRPVGERGARIDAVIEVPQEPVRAVLNPQALVDAIAHVEQFVPAGRDRDEEQVVQEATRRFLVVQWGNERFALPLERVMRLDPPTNIRRVDSDLFQGVISTGGDVVPVLDPGQFYGMAHRTDQLEGFMIIARDEVIYAVPLEHAERIIDVPESALQRTQGAADQRFSGTIRFEDGLISAIELSHFHTLAQNAQQALP